MTVLECPLWAKSGLMHRSKQLIAESASVRNSHGVTGVRIPSGAAADLKRRKNSEN